MIWIKKIIFWTLLILSANQTLIYAKTSLPIYLKILIGLALTGFVILYNIHPFSEKQPESNLKRLKSCDDILFSAAILTAFATLITILLLSVWQLSVLIFILNLIISLLASYLLVINGLVRSFILSRQLSLIFRVLLLSFWWLPIFNSIMAFRLSRNLHAEFSFDKGKFLRNQERKAQKVCETHYPLVMVHGIFFRDWEIFNYWGRIPAELEANGARIYYGEHESSLPVVESATQLKAKILDILRQTGAEKVNIIAHSKGGIDSRYAISCLGLAEHVASLTTINSPHYGSDLAGKMLSLTPKKIITSLGKQYSRLFTRLGDSNCDFVGSVDELTPERCAELNQLMPDADEVYYQSLGSAMTSRKAAPFPLSLGYTIIKPISGDNDGLVSTKSMVWGNFLGISRPSGKKGLSHGDMIDLSRHNIKGFDVLEFYVKLVNGLKMKGF